MVIQTNARDNSGLSPTLVVQVSSSEPPEVDGSGNTIPDVLITEIDQAAGLVYLRLRAERAGTGPGRIYTVTITATDASGNHSAASVQIKAPHDRRAAR